MCFPLPGTGHAAALRPPGPPWGGRRCPSQTGRRSSTDRSLGSGLHPRASCVAPAPASGLQGSPPPAPGEASSDPVPHTRRSKRRRGAKEEAGRGPPRGEAPAGASSLPPSRTARWRPGPAGCSRARRALPQNPLPAKRPRSSSQFTQRGPRAAAPSACGRGCRLPGCGKNPDARRARAPMNRLYSAPSFTLPILSPPTHLSFY